MCKWQKQSYCRSLNPYLIRSVPSPVILSFPLFSEELKAAKSAENDLKKIADKLTAICAVLHDAEKKKYSNEAMKVWLRDLKRVVYDIDDLLDEVAFDALQRRANDGHLSRKLWYYFSSSNPIIFSFHVSHKIRDLCEQLEHIVAKKNDFGLTESPIEYSTADIRNPLDRSSYVHVPDVVGRDEAKQDVIRRLESFNGVRELSVLPIVGMGGIGKTTFAKLVHHDVHHFDLKLWVCVSDTFHIPKIIGDILEDGNVDSAPNQDMSILVKKLHRLLSGKKYLLVLDDVWVEEFGKWKELKDLLVLDDLLHDLAVNIMAEKLVVVTLDKMTDLDHARHIVWGYEKADSLKEEQFPTELLRAKRARSFQFGYFMKHVSMSFLEGIISNLSCLRVLTLHTLWFEELPKSIGTLKHLRYLKLVI